MRELILLFIIATLLGLWYLWPLPIQLTNHVINTGDPLFYAWNLIHNWQSIFNPTTLLDTNIFYPETNTLALSDTLFAQTLFTFPLLTLTGNPILAQNLYLLLTFPLSAVSMYLLTHYITHSRLSALAAAIFFAFSLPRLSQISHITIISSQFLPLLILYFIKMLETPSLRHTLLFTTFFLITTASTLYFAVLSSLIFIVILFWYLFQWSKSHQVKKNFSLTLSKTLPLLVPGLILLVIITYPYLRFTLEHPEIRRSLEDSSARSAQVSDYLRVLPNSWLASLGFPTHSDEKALYPTLTVLSLAHYALVKYRHHSYIHLFLLIALFSFIMSLGPSQTFIIGPLDTGYITLPYTYIYKLYPLLSIIRVPARFSIFLIIGLTTLATISLSKINNKFITLALIGLFIFETALFHHKTVPIPQYSNLPPVYNWLKVQSGRVVAVELPIPEISPIRPFAEQVATPYEKLDETYPLPLETFRVYFSGYHRKNLVNGYSSLLPKRYQESVIEAGRFPSSTSFGLFRARGVTHIIIHLNQYLPENKNNLLKALGNTPELKLITKFPDTQVYVWNKQL